MANTQHEALETALAYISDINPSKLNIRENSQEGDVDTVIMIAKTLRSYGIVNCKYFSQQGKDHPRHSKSNNPPRNQFATLRQVASQLVGVIKQLEQEPQTSTNRDDIQNEFDTFTSDFMRESIPILVILLCEVNEKRAKEFDVVFTQVKSDAEQINGLLGRSQEQVAGQAVSKHAIRFSDLAGTYSKRSRNWIVAASSLIVITVALGLYLFSETQTNLPMDSSLSWHLLVIKAVILSLAGFSVMWCAKNARINAHLASATQHRSTALETFQTFVAAADKDRDMRDAILMETTRAIFSYGQSGFVGGDDSSDRSHIIEIVKSLTKGSP